MKEETYFFRMSAYQDRLMRDIREGRLKILPESRRNEVLGFLEHNKLSDLSVSRPKSRLAWGIPIPFDPEHVTYVWFDALVNYISAVGFGADAEKFKKWWPADIHLIGKDIIRHHAVIWPALLYALDIELPKMVFAHGWWVQGGEKMSKSRGNAVDPTEIVRTYGVDAYRYFLMRETPFGQDGTFSEEALILRTNTDLANDLGNLLHRTLSMGEKYFGGRIPDFPGNPGSSPVEKDALALMVAGDELIEGVDKLLADAAFSEALALIWGVVTRANQFIETSAPWTLFKEKREKELQLVICALAEVLRDTAQSVWPFMPRTGQAMWTQLGLTFPIDRLEKTPPKNHTMFGRQTAKGAPLFPRILTEEEKAKLAQTPPKPKK
jgi:methionyl-tRNA synthetase